MLIASILCFSSLFQFLLQCINETLSFVCDLNVLLLFDESKGGEKLEALKLEFKGIELRKC